MIVYTKIFRFKREYRYDIKMRETRPGWMDACCHGDDLRTLTINSRHMPYYCHRLCSLHDNIVGHVAVDC